MKVKCICKECVEYGLVGTASDFYPSPNYRKICMVKWENGLQSAMYAEELKEVR